MNLQAEVPGCVKSGGSSINIWAMSLYWRKIVFNCRPSAVHLLELWISMLQSTSLLGISDSCLPKGKWPWLELPLVAQKPLLQPTEQQFNPTHSSWNTSSVSGTLMCIVLHPVYPGYLELSLTTPGVSGRKHSFLICARFCCLWTKFCCYWRMDALRASSWAKIS